MKKLITLLLAVVMSFSCLGLVACGGSDSIVVYTNAFFAPFEYYDGTNIVGVDVEIMDKVGEKMGKKVVFENKDFATLIDTTAAGKLCDCSAAGITITEKRAEKVAFSIPYYTSVQYVIFKKDSLTVSKNTNNEDVIFWETLAGKKIGVQLDTTGNIYVELEIEGDASDDYTGVLQGSGAQCKPYETAQIAFETLKANNAIDAVVIDKLPAQYLIKNDLDSYIALPLYYDAETATSEDYAIAVNKNKTELLDAINEVLQELLDAKDANGNNGIEQLVMKHFGA